MHKVTRYVLWELLSVFLITLTGLTLILILAGVAKEGLREGLGLGPILRMIPFVIPVALQISLPATILMAACSVFGRMSADNEIVAIKSLGITPLQVIRPALCLAFVLSLVAVWVSDIAVSWGRTGIYRVVVESVEEVAYNMLKTQRSYSTRSFSINVKDVVGRQLLSPTIQVATGGSAPPINITASRAELKTDTERSSLSIELFNGRIDVGDWSIAFPEHYEQVIPLLDATRKGNSVDSPSLIPLRRISSEMREQREATERLEVAGATAAAFQLISGDMAALANQAKWTGRQDLIAGARARLHRLHLEPWRRWATGFSCFFFVLLGAPLAIHMRTSNFFTTFAACFGPILLLYYPLLALAVDRCKDGALPPYAVWLGNLVLLCVGLWTLRRVLRY